MAGVPIVVDKLSWGLLVNVCRAKASLSSWLGDHDRVRYEHCARTIADCGGNVSKAARRLGVHRQSLQRWLRKPAPKK